MKTINNNNFRKLSSDRMNETMGGYYVVITLPNGRVITVRV
jgi:hypothetical protein